MCPEGGGGLPGEVNAGKVLNRILREPAPLVIRSNNRIIEASGGSGDDQDIEVRKPKMRAVDLLRVDREVEQEFLIKRRALEIGRVDRLGAAIRLDAGAEEVRRVAVDNPADAKRRAIGDDM